MEKRVFKNLKLFKENKKEEDDLFDRLNTSILNQYLQQLMEGLTAKVFRYHPSQNVFLSYFLQNSPLLPTAFSYNILFSLALLAKYSP